MKSIYLLEASNENEKYYKIGKSKNPYKRVKDLQTGNSFDLDVVFIYEADNDVINKLEKTLHEHYKTHKIKGEWFDLEQDDVDNFINECQKIEKQLKLIQDNNTYYNSIKNNNF